MDYDLVKKLKDAGFPFNWKNDDISPDCNYPHKDVTLSELIEACGVQIYLDGIGEDWSAYDKMAYCCYGGDYNNIGTGKTPEEAVAKLWLELNNK